MAPVGALEGQPHSHQQRAAWMLKQKGRAGRQERLYKAAACTALQCTSQMASPQLQTLFASMLMHRLSFELMMSYKERINNKICAMKAAQFELNIDL
eukprot:scaffold214785_cov17-Tisochrysis_lutea.AAC.1